MTTKLTDVITTTTLNVFFNPPVEVRGGFCEVMTVEFSDYGPEEPDGQQFSISLRCKGREKTSSGKPDMRTRDRGLLVNHKDDELRLFLKCSEQSTDARVLAIREFAKTELDNNAEQWQKMGY